MKRTIFATLFVVCAALPALGAELEFSANGEVEYDDNFFRTEENKDDDVLFRLRPGVRIHEDRGDDLNFSAGYEAPVELSIENSSDANDVDHIGTGIFDYHVNDRLRFSGRDRYSYIRSTLRQPDTIVDTGTLEFTDQRDRIKLNDAQLGVDYLFSPRTVARAIVTSTFFDSSRHDRARVWSVGGSADAQYKLSLKHQLGAGAGYTYQNFGDRDDIPGSQTDTYRLFGTWRWAVSETLTWELTAGPAYLDTEQDDADDVELGVLRWVSFVSQDDQLFASNFSSCDLIDGQPVDSKCDANFAVSQADLAAVLGDTVNVANVNPSGESDSEITGFANAVLSQRWSPTLATALRYSREQGDASGLGGTVIVDAVSLSNTWDFAERWQLALRGDYTRRESAFEIAQTYIIVEQAALPSGALAAARTATAFNSNRDVDIDTDTWGVAGRITHRLFKTTSLYVQARYSQQSSSSDSLGNVSDFENFLATFGVRHVFEPIPLW